MNTQKSSAAHIISAWETHSHIYTQSDFTYGTYFWNLLQKGWTFATISTHQTPSFTFSLSNTNAHSFSGYIMSTHYGKTSYCDYYFLLLSNRYLISPQAIFNPGCVIFFFFNSMKYITLIFQSNKVKTFESKWKPLQRHNCHGFHHIVLSLVEQIEQRVYKCRTKQRVKA